MSHRALLCVHPWHVPYLAWTLRGPGAHWGTLSYWLAAGFGPALLLCWASQGLFLPGPWVGHGTSQLGQAGSTIVPSAFRRVALDSSVFPVLAGGGQRPGQGVESSGTSKGRTFGLDPWAA